MLNIARGVINTIWSLIMKMVIAFIKPNKFDEVMLALHKVEGLEAELRQVRNDKHSYLSRP